MIFRNLLGGGLVLLACSIWAQGGGSNLKIPVALGPDNYAHLSVRVNGEKPLDFIFDTGASTCVLTELGKAKMNGLRFDRLQETLGSGGVTRQPVATGVKLTLASRDWPNQQLMFVDYHGSLHADGVIGYNLFSNKTISLDNDRGVLEVYDQPPKSQNSQFLNVTMKDDLAFIPIAIAHGAVTDTDLFAVDTGYGGALTIAYPFAERAHLPGNLPTFGKGKSGGTGKGVVEITAVRFPQVSLGGQTLQDVPADVQQSGHKDFKTWNILGNELFKRFNWTWDIKGKRIYLTPSHHFSEPYPTLKNNRFVRVAILSGLVLVFGCVLFVRQKRKLARQ